MSEEEFRKRPILGGRLLTPIDEEAAPSDIRMSGAWIHPSGGHSEGWIGRYKKMDIPQYDCSMYWKDYVDWYHQIIEMRSADQHTKVSVSWINEVKELDLPIVGWTRKGVAQKGLCYLVIYMDRAHADGEVRFHIGSFLTPDEFDEAMVRSEKIYKHEPRLDKCQLYGEMIAHWLVTNYFIETEDSYWHDDEECDWSTDHDPKLVSSVLDLSVEKEITAQFWNYEEGITSYDFFWRMGAGKMTEDDLTGALWLNENKEDVEADQMSRDSAEPAQVGGGPINVSTYISYKDRRSPVRVNLTKGEINSYCVEEVKCKSCMQTVIVSYLSVQKSKQSTKCPTCKKQEIWFG